MGYWLITYKSGKPYDKKEQNKVIDCRPEVWLETELRSYKKQPKIEQGLLCSPPTLLYAKRVRESDAIILHNLFEDIEIERK